MSMTQSQKARAELSSLENDYNKLVADLNKLRDEKKLSPEECSQKILKAKKDLDIKARDCKDRMIDIDESKLTNIQKANRHFQELMGDSLHHPDVVGKTLTREEFRNILNENKKKTDELYNL